VNYTKLRWDYFDMEVLIYPKAVGPTTTKNQFSSLAEVN
jgi:hypothetical protein